MEELVQETLPLGKPQVSSEQGNEKADRRGAKSGSPGWGKASPQAWGKARGMGRGLCRKQGKAGVGGAWKHSPGPGGKRRGAVASPREPLSLSGPQCEKAWARAWVFVLMDILKNTRCTLDQTSQTQRINMVFSVGIPMGRPVTSIQRYSPDLSHIGNIIDLKTFLFKL